MKILELNVNEESKAVGADRTVAVRTDSVVSVEQVNTKVIVTCQFGVRLTKYTEHFNTWQAAQIRYEELLCAISGKPVVSVATPTSGKTSETNPLGWPDESIAAALMRCSVEISNSANIPAHVFCEYSGHVKVLKVSVYAPGWTPNAEPDFLYDSQQLPSTEADVYKDAYVVHDPKDMLWILQRMIAGAKDGVEASTDEIINGDYAAKIACDFEDYKSENRPMRTARLYADGDVYADTTTIDTVDKE